MASKTLFERNILSRERVLKDARKRPTERILTKEGTAEKYDLF